ncbi:alkaline phosphatase, partial [Bifidobacterium breve]|uniref:alkaline phosphatase n=1 Tax=Bifidobacterium breve TaxID=1685 RepID=UPI00254D5612
VTESAASGTAWATGTKTYNGAIGVDLAQKPQENLLEKAKRAGLKTGNITTSEVQDATPAVMGAHVTSRSHYAPSGNA